LTALAVAAGRAVESSRPDRLIDDPFAEAFVHAARSPVLLPVRWPQEGTAVSDQEALLLQGSSYLGVRSRFFDDYLHHACSTGIRQVVLLGAGLDARAFRLDWPGGLRLFEIDQPPVLRFKDAVLRETGARPRCDHTMVAVDLREGWHPALLDAGHDPAAPTAWLAEGLLHYLPAPAQQQLLVGIHELSATGSRLGLERPVNLAGLAADSRGRLREMSERSGIDLEHLIHTDGRPDPIDWLTEHGWTITDQPATTVAERYHRALIDPHLPLPTTSSRSEVQVTTEDRDRPSVSLTTASKA